MIQGLLDDIDGWLMYKIGFQIWLPASNSTFFASRIFVPKKHLYKPQPFDQEDNSVTLEPCTWHLLYTVKQNMCFDVVLPPKCSNLSESNIHTFRI